MLIKQNIEHIYFQQRSRTLSRPVGDPWSATWANCKVSLQDNTNWIKLSYAHWCGVRTSICHGINSCVSMNELISTSTSLLTRCPSPSGVVDPYSELDCEVVWHPSFSASTEGDFELRVHKGNVQRLHCVAKVDLTRKWSHAHVSVIRRVVVAQELVIPSETDDSSGQRTTNRFKESKLHPLLLSVLLLKGCCCCCCCRWQSHCYSHPGGIHPCSVGRQVRHVRISPS